MKEQDETTLEVVVNDFKNYLGYNLGQTVLAGIAMLTDLKKNASNPEHLELIVNKFRNSSDREFLYNVTNEELLTILKEAIKHERE